MTRAHDPRVAPPRRAARPRPGLRAPADTASSAANAALLPRPRRAPGRVRRARRGSGRCNGRRWSAPPPRTPCSAAWSRPPSAAGCSPRSHRRRPLGARAHRRHAGRRARPAARRLRGGGHPAAPVRAARLGRPRRPGSGGPRRGLDGPHPVRRPRRVDADRHRARRLRAHGLAALLAFAPRRRGTFGLPGAAAVALGVLYTCPVMQHDIRVPYLAGLLFALLLATFLWLERVEQRSAGTAGGLVAVAALGGYAAAPRIDGDRPCSTTSRSRSRSAPPRPRSTAGTTTTDRWTGRATAARSCASAPPGGLLEGRQPRRVRRHPLGPGHRQAGDPWRAGPSTRLEADGSRVTLRALRTSQFVTAGSALDIPHDAAHPDQHDTRNLRERRRAAAPRPRLPRDRLHAAPDERPGCAVPAPTTPICRANTASCACRRRPQAPATVRARRRRPPCARAAAADRRSSPWWSASGAPSIVGAPQPRRDRRHRGLPLRARLRARPPPARRQARRRLGRPARSSATSPASHFSYSETPRRSLVPLVDFLLGDQVGYCQQFSGAMALLLRMGGVPARVASGFSPGGLGQGARRVRRARRRRALVGGGLTCPTPAG